MGKCVPVRIQFVCRKDHCALMSPVLLRRLKILARQSVLVRTGHRSVTAKLKSSPSMKQNRIHISNVLRNKLLLPNSCYLLAKFDRELRLGPIVGILSGRLSPKIKNIFHLLKNKPMVLYGFTPRDVNWFELTVRGAVQTSGVWKHARFPLPDVVYNRLNSRSAYRQQHVKAFFRKLKTHIGDTMFNPSFFNKGTIHQLLMRDSVMRAYLPDTYVAPSVDQVKRLILKHGSIYLKPLTGSLGKGIYRLSRSPDGAYLCQARFNGKSFSRKYTKLVDAYRHVLPGKRCRSYLAQQGIELCRLEGNFFDFRVHLNKDSQDVWRVSAIGANVFGFNKITTHGGWIKSIRDVLIPVFGKKAPFLEKKLRMVAIRGAKALERGLGKKLGELGFDLGIDRKGNIWLFEINAMPGHHIFKHRKLKPKLKRSIQNLTGYMTYLSNFK